MIFKFKALICLIVCIHAQIALLSGFKSIVSGIYSKYVSPLITGKEYECDRLALLNVGIEMKLLKDDENYSLDDLLERLKRIKDIYGENQQLRDPISIYKFSEYASLSYGTRDEVEHASNFSPLLTGPFEIVSWYQPDPAQNVDQYVVTASKTDKLIVISFQGTSGILDIFHDINGLKYVPSPTSRFRNDRECPVKSSGEEFFIFLGFRMALSSSARAVEDLLKALEKNPGYRVVCVGHSLGGARALLFALFLRLHYRKQVSLHAVYTFGQPIVGSAAFNNWAAACIGEEKIVRVVSATDAVPWLRSMDGVNRHPDNVIEVWGPSRFDLNFKYCKGSMDKRCSYGVPCSHRGAKSHSWIAGHPVGGSILKVINS